MMATDPIGLYVHIPFCVRKCNYCDFFSGAASEETILRYTDALVGEIKGYEREKKISVDSIFFGGGTPSILPSDQFERIVNAIRASFEIVDNTEFTVEVNPGAVSREKLLVYNRLGVNRLSIGLQSIHENELKKLGRIHTFADFLETYNISREVGFRNINVDLMYGIPNQTKESFYQTLKAVLEISVEHISCYGLIVEEGTPFFAEKIRSPYPARMKRLICILWRQESFAAPVTVITRYRIIQSPVKNAGITLNIGATRSTSALAHLPIRIIIRKDIIMSLI
ncbi:MAG: radical SAM family heme chaperone HemW [Clostridia bacterium]|nr:radical SAM family heme chaperone HemW [Clostridia bacterium]